MYAPGSYPEDIAVDPIIKRVFYTDTGLDHIASLDYDGSNHEIALQINPLHPTAIVLQPETRYVHAGASSSLFRGGSRPQSSAARAEILWVLSAYKYKIVHA